jgi:hypothetical protein
LELGQIAMIFVLGRADMFVLRVGEGSSVPFRIALHINFKAELAREEEKSWTAVVFWDLGVRLVECWLRRRARSARPAWDQIQVWWANGRIRWHWPEGQRLEGVAGIRVKSSKNVIFEIAGSG